MLRLRRSRNHWLIKEESFPAEACSYETLRRYDPRERFGQDRHLSSIQWEEEMRLKKEFVSISFQALTAIKNELDRFPGTETGGLLLGYSGTLHGISVLAATDGGYQGVIHEPNCFQYDAAYEAHICRIISELYDPPLELVGLWHKHNQKAVPLFSCADEDMHRQLLESADFPCLSILFERREEGDYDVRVFLLKKSGEHEDVTEHTIFEEK